MARRKRGGRQDRVDDETPNAQQKAKADFMEKSADFASKKARWEEAKKTKEVRESDLVKVHTHTPFDPSAAANVAKEAARAIEAEKTTLEEKQASKKALDEAYVAWRSFDTPEPIRSLIPDDEDDAPGAGERDDEEQDNPDA